MDDVLIKVCALNDFYSTNIFSPFSVAKHIVELKIDERLNNDDLELVNEIAKVNVKDDIVRNFYSFATKYCRPTIYPIFDSYVEKVLKHFRKIDKFHTFKNDDLKNYPSYKNIILEFKNFYNLSEFDVKQTDKYLWLLGKECFPKKYKKKKKRELITTFKT